MEKERRIKTLSLVALIVAVLGLTVAFAALSQTLKINSTGFIAQEDMQIRIQGDEKRYYENEAMQQTFFCLGCNDAYYTPNMQEPYDTLEGFNFTFQKPGDLGIIRFFTANYGDMDVKLDQIIVNEPVCTSETGNEEDAKLVCNNLIIKPIHYDLTGNDLDNLPLLNIGEELLASKSMHMEDHYTVSDAYGLFVQLDGNLDKVPSSNVTVSNLGFKIKYVQK